jgi:hypothetical protein
MLRSAAFVLIAAMLISCFALAGCTKTDPVPLAGPTESPSADPTSEPQTTSTPVPTPPSAAPIAITVDDTPAEWTVYWYVCGSNLESLYGCASNDLNEALAVAIPENVRVVIETGGSYQWHNEAVSNGAIQRFLLDSKGLTLVDEQPDANMGEAETLASFLYFCETNFPSEHKMMLFWNHGGGTVTGAAFDETHGYDSLTLREFASAFGVVYPDAAEPPFDLVGFDACLMSTIDVANTFRGVASYMVASEELEPGCGWHYTGWLGALAKDPYIDAASLGKAICDSYLKGCRDQGVDHEITLALTDLGKLGKLTDSYNELGNEALLLALTDPNFFAHFGREARVSENYGGNTREQGYSNMVDLGDLVRNSAELFPSTAESVLEAIGDCVLYRINGDYRVEATGLSCYYSYNADINDFASYSLVGASEAFKYLYAYGLTGQLSSAGIEYVGKLGFVIDESKLEQTGNGLVYVPHRGSPMILGGAGGDDPHLILLGPYMGSGPDDYDDEDTYDWDSYWEYQQWLAQQEYEQRQKELEEQRRLEEEQRRLEEEEQRRLEEERLKAEREKQQQYYQWWLQQQQQQEQEPPYAPVRTLQDFDLGASMWVVVNDEAYPELHMTPEFADAISEVRVKVRQMIEVDEDRIDLVDWGTSERINTNWREGVANAWFSGFWSSIGGSALNNEICYSCDDYVIFSSPILLNGERCNLHYVLEKTVETLRSGAIHTSYDWRILGARKARDEETGMPDKYLRQLQRGDEIIPVYYVRQDVNDPDSAWEEYILRDNAVTYVDEDQLDLMTDFGQAVYLVQFEVIDCRNQSAFSEEVLVQVFDNLVLAQLYSENLEGLDTAEVRIR